MALKLLAGYVVLFLAKFLVNKAYTSFACTEVYTYSYYS